MFTTFMCYVDHLCCLPTNIWSSWCSYLFEVAPNKCRMTGLWRCWAWFNNNFYASPNGSNCLLSWYSLFPCAVDFYCCPKSIKYRSEPHCCTVWPVPSLPYTPQFIFCLNPTKTIQFPWILQHQMYNNLLQKTSQISCFQKTTFKKWNYILAACF